jgi:hypothetical protein
MSNKTRAILALIITGAIAALATPQASELLSSKLAPGVTTILAAGLAGVLHKMDAQRKEEEAEAKADEDKQLPLPLDEGK